MSNAEQQLANALQQLQAVQAQQEKDVEIPDTPSDADLAQAASLAEAAFADPVTGNTGPDPWRNCPKAIRTPHGKGTLNPDIG
eukprot:6069064-Karenia_brevis.AAC.1